MKPVTLKEVNLLGIYLYIPILFILGMFYNAPAFGRSWTDYYFLAAHLAVGPLCLVGLLNPEASKIGLWAFALAISAWVFGGFLK